MHKFNSILSNTMYRWKKCKSLEEHLNWLIFNHYRPLVLVTCKVSRYCSLALHDRAIFPIARLGSSRPQDCGVKKPSLAIGKMDIAICYTHRGTRAGVGGLGLGVVVTGEGVAEVVGCCRSYRRDRISSRSSVVTIWRSSVNRSNRIIWMNKIQKYTIYK